MACASPGVIGTDRLVASFIEAIQAGDEQLAKDLVVPMSNCHLKLDIKVSPNGYAGQRTKEKVFSVNVHMEDRESSGHVELFVKSADSIADLKRKVWVQRNIPVDAQRWIIGKKFPDDDMTLGKCGVNFTGHTLFLYIVTAPEPKIESEREQNRNDNYENFLASPTFMSNTLSYQEGRKQSDTLLMAPNAQYDTLQKSAPPPIPERVPLQDEYDDSDEQTKVVPYPARRMAPVPPSMNGRSQELWNSLMHVIPPPSQGNRAPQQVEESLGWECPVCTFVNLPTRPGCEMCSEDRPEGYAVPDNYQMTDEEVAMQVQQEELERLTRQDHEATLRNNYNMWLTLDDHDLIRNTETFTCPICFDDYEPGEGITLRDCLHQFCKECLQGAVMHSEEPTLTCPYQDEDVFCDSVLQEREIRALVPEDVFVKYLQRGLDQAESQAANSFHCKTTDCKGWCLYEDEVNFFHCPICKKENCLTCKVIHTGQNCKEYQQDLAMKALQDDAAKRTQDLIKSMVEDGSAMHCPQCKIIVQKKDGCDWIKCSVCKTEICWVTKGARWGPRGNGDTSGGCRCGVNGIRCHNRCANCH